MISRIDKEKHDALIKEAVKKNSSYIPEYIEFTSYCKQKMTDRGIEKDFVLKVILGDRHPYFVEVQQTTHEGMPETRHKMVFKISSRYSLIVVVVYSKNILKVINVIKTSKSAEKLWRKKISE